MSSTRASAGVLRALRARLGAAGASPGPRAALGPGPVEARFSRGASTSGAAFDAASTSASGSGPSRASTSSPSTRGADTDASAAPLYPGHVRLTLAQKALLAVTSGVGAALYPERADLVGAAARRRVSSRYAPRATACARTRPVRGFCVTGRESQPKRWSARARARKARSDTRGRRL